MLHFQYKDPMNIMSINHNMPQVKIYFSRSWPLIWFTLSRSLSPVCLCNRCSMFVWSAHCPTYFKTIWKSSHFSKIVLILFFAYLLLSNRLPRQISRSNFTENFQKTASRGASQIQKPSCGEDGSSNSRRSCSNFAATTAVQIKVSVYRRGMSLDIKVSIC